MGFFDSIKQIIGGAPKQENTPVNPSQAAVAQKVLVVEDEDLLATALEAKLKHEGFTVMRAANGQIGLDVAQTFLPDIILVDIMMPVMDGKAMLSRLRQIPQFAHTPVIILTNSGTVENMKETQVYSGANDFLIKSNVNLDEVIIKIRNNLPQQDVAPSPTSS